MKHIGMATLGRDAEVRRTPGGEAVANLSLAVNYYDKNAENNRATQWIDATLWGKQAETLGQYLTKGSQHCFTLSDMHIESYEGRNGTGHKLVARVDAVELGRRSDAPSGNGGGGSAPQQRQQPQQRQAPASKPASGFDDMDDDIPF